MENKLTYLQALKVMMKFLDSYYEKTLSDDIGSLLGDISLLHEDDSTVDSAAWEDWIDAINEVLRIDSSSNANANLSPLQAFRAMIHFVKNYGDRTSSDDIQILLKKMNLSQNNSTNDPIIWHEWTQYIDEILGSKGASYGYLELHK